MSKKLTASRLEKLTNKFIREQLLPFNFNEVSETGAVIRRLDSKFQYVSVVIYSFGYDIKAEPYCRVGFDEASKIYSKYMDAAEDSGFMQISYSYFTKDVHEYLICNTEEDLSAYYKEFGDLLIEDIVPTLDYYSDPKIVLNAYLNYDFTLKNNLDVIAWQGYTDACFGLIMARLYGNEYYSELKEKYSKLFDPLLPKYREKVDDLIRYLDQDTLDSHAT